MVFIEDYEFEKRRRGLLDDDQLFELMKWLAINPEAGKVIPGTGGLRKARYAAKGQGKRGGARVIYFWWISDAKILLLDIYSKNEQEDLSVDKLERLQRKVLR